MYYVYRIINKINNKSYIGITSRTPEQRWEEHLSRAHNDIRFSRLYCAIRKYGEDNFIVSEIDCTSNEDEVRKLEKKYIVKYDSYKNGYNCNYGGCGHLHISDELKRKISDAQKDKIISLESRRKMALAKKGRKECADHLGEHTLKGNKNPRAKYFLIQFPDGHIEVVQGIRQFCRDHDLMYCHFSPKGRAKGYKLLKRFTDYPEGEYIQADGKGAYPTFEGKDIVDTVWQHAAVHKRTGII